MVQVKLKNICFFAKIDFKQILETKPPFVPAAPNSTFSGYFKDVPIVNLEDLDKTSNCIGQADCENCLESNCQDRISGFTSKNTNVLVRETLRVRRANSDSKTRR